MPSDALVILPGMTATPTRTAASKRPDQNLVSLMIRNFPVPLKRRIAKVAKRQNASFNDVAVTALAERLGVEFHPSGRVPAYRPGNSKLVTLKVPLALRDIVYHSAIDARVTNQSFVIAILSQAFKEAK